MKHSFSKSTKSKGGFSLIELLVAVAIISIVASVAQPAYQNYHARARQTEAKGALATVFSAEKSFQSEYGSYSACLADIGFAPEGMHRYYTVGFVQGFQGYADAPMKDLFFNANISTCDTNGSLGSVPDHTWFKANAFAPPVSGMIRYAGATEIPGDSGVAPNKFLVYAVGHVGISSGNGGIGKFDYWSIDNHKDMMATSDMGATKTANASGFLDPVLLPVD